MAVEFALISVFVLGPLLAGTADYLILLTARAQLNTALQALYYFGWTNPGAANNDIYAGDVISNINKGGSIYLIALAKTSATYTTLVYACAPPAATAYTTTAPVCPSAQTLQEFVEYRVTSSVALPFPIPLVSPVLLSVYGQVQIQ